MNARILLVDDDPEILKIASVLLEHAGFDVATSENVIDALDVARRETFDVVVTDANMNPHSGFDFIRSLKLIAAYDLVPIAMLTGRREKRDVERALSVGAQDYIVKPLDPEHFVKKITELATRSESARRTARFAELRMVEIGTCEVPLVVVGLNEAGVLLDSDHNLHVGSQVAIECELFARIGVPKPQIRITSCTRGEVSGTFEVRGTFHGIEEKNLIKIRQYVQARTATIKLAKAS